MGEIDRRLSDHAGVMADILDRSKRFEATTTEILGLSSIIKSMHDKQQRDCAAGAPAAGAPPAPPPGRTADAPAIRTRAQLKRAGGPAVVHLEQVMLEAQLARRRRTGAPAAAPAAASPAAHEADDDGEITGIVIANSLSRQQSRLAAFNRGR